MSKLNEIDDLRQKALANLKKIETGKKFSEFAIDVFNEVGLKAESTKAKDMLDQLYNIAITGEKDDDKIKAIKTFGEMVGGGLNEKQTNIQNNNYGDIFLDILSDDKK